MGSSFFFREYLQYIKTNNPQSTYAVHIPNQQHECGPRNGSGAYEISKQRNTRELYRKFVSLYQHHKFLISEKHTLSQHTRRPAIQHLL